MKSTVIVMAALSWLFLALYLFISPLPALSICAAVFACGYLAMQPRVGDAEDALTVWTPPKTNPYVLSHLDNNREMDHTERLHDRVRSLQCQNISTTCPVEESEPRINTNATRHHAFRNQPATHTTGRSRYDFSSKQDWAPGHTSNNSESRAVVQKVKPASYTRNVMRDDAVRNVLGWNAAEDEERGRMLPLSSGHWTMQKPSPYIGQVSTAMILAPASHTLPQSQTDNGKNGRVAVGYMRDIYNTAARLYDHHREELVGNTFWSQFGADPELTKYMRHTRIRVQTIMKWTSVEGDGESPDFSSVTLQELQHDLRLLGQPFDNLLKIFMQGATCMGSTSEAGYAYDQLRKADAFFKQWSPAPSTVQQQPAGFVPTSTQGHASGDSRSHVHAQIATGMFKIHETKRAIISGLRGRSTDQAAWQAAFPASNGQTFPMTVQNTMRGITAWASVQGTSGQADPSKLQLHELFTLGLIGQEFDELRELFHLAAQNVGTNHVIKARDALVGATQFFGQWVPAPAPGWPSNNGPGSQPPPGTQPTQQPSGPSSGTNGTNGTGSNGNGNQPAPGPGAPAGQVPAIVQGRPPIVLPDGATLVAKNQQLVISYVQAYINDFSSFPSDAQQALNDPQWITRLTDLARDMPVIKQWACANSTKKSDSRLTDDIARQSGFRTAAWKAAFQPLSNLEKQGFQLTAIGAAGRACRSMDGLFGMSNVQHAIQ